MTCHTLAGSLTTQEICEGDSITPIDFTVSNGATSAILVGAPDGIVITPEGGNVFRVSGSVNENITLTTTYNFSVTTQGNGCTAAPIPVSIEVNPSKEIALTSSANTTSQIVCEGNTITPITYALAGGATGAEVSSLPSGLSYNVNGGIVTIAGTLTDNISAITTYSYTVTVTGGCPTTSPVTQTGTIEVNPDHKMTVSGLTTQEICEGDSITPIDFTVSNGATSAILVGAPDGIVITPEGGNVFRVSGSVNENIGTSSIYNFSVTTQGNGCTAAPIPVSIEVNPDQELNLTSSNAVQEICEGESIQDITYALAGGATGVTITGLPNGVTHTVNAGLVTISGTPSDDVDGTTLPFTYTVTSTGSCDPALSLQGTITVKPGHDMSYTGGSLTQEICEGDSITPIDFTVSNGATSAILVGAPDGIVITPEGGNVFRVSGSVNENIGTSSIYNFSVTTQGNGCTAAPIPVSIEVNPDQELNLTSSNAVQEICEGESIQDITYALAGVQLELLLLDYQMA